MPDRPSRLRRLRTRFVYLRILAREFWFSLLIAAVTWGAGAWLHWTYPSRPEDAGDVAKAFFDTLVLLSLNLNDNFPRDWHLRPAYFLVPLVSALVISEAVVRLAVILSSKDSSGKRWVDAMVAVYDKHIILCGMGRLGFCILQELRKMGRDVVAIEKSEQAYGVAEARRLGVPVVIADARNERVLEEYGVKRAEAVIAGTNDDMTNLEIALDARELNPGLRVVVRMFNQQLGRKIANNFDIKLIFSTSALAAPSFAAATVEGAIVQSFYIDNQLLQTVKLKIAEGSPLIGKPLSHLLEGRDVFILSHRPKGGAADLFPAADKLLRADDRVAVLAQGAVVEQLHALNRRA